MSYDSILIVDDSATSRMIIKRCFEMAGFRSSSFHEAEDGLKALTFLKQHRVDLILTDLRMPKMDGSTFIKKVKVMENTRDVPVVVISSMGNEALEKTLWDDGVAGVIRKPLSPAKVVETMEDRNV